MFTKIINNEKVSARALLFMLFVQSPVSPIFLLFAENGEKTVKSSRGRPRKSVEVEDEDFRYLKLGLFTQWSHMHVICRINQNGSTVLSISANH